MKYMCLILILISADLSAEIKAEPVEFCGLRGTFRNAVSNVEVTCYEKRSELVNTCKSIPGSRISSENWGCVMIDTSTGHCAIHVMIIRNMRDRLDKRRLAYLGEEFMHCLIGQFHS